VLILRHDTDAGPGYLGEALAQAGIEARVVDPAAEEILEGLDWAGIVSLGGSMGAYEEAAYPWLHAEKRLLAGAVAAGIPTLGICLGCQLLADALGGRAYPAGGRELGVVRVALTPQGRADPVARHLEGPMVVSHADTWDLPPGASLLAASARYRQAFRLGSGLGLQPHPEVGPDAFARWVHEKPRAALEAEGIDPEAAIEAVAAHAAVQRTVAAVLFGAWAAEVASR
jgi:GMP synthase (glutamine-hydrolysing)